MTTENNQRWQLIRESIKFQIKLILDAGRDLILSPVAIICTVLDLSKDNSKDEGHFQRLMLWGHSTDHWLNLFGDLPADKKPSSAESAGNNEHEESQNGTENDGDEAVPENASVIKNQVDENLDKLFSKIELLLPLLLRQNCQYRKLMKKSLTIKAARWIKFIRFFSRALA